MKQSDASKALQRLMDIMAKLRGPGGCPWDRRQTPASLAPYIIEEACEVVEAIECGNPESIREELGDLLLQIVFQAGIFAERGSFDMAAVARGIGDKMVRRHPHVFAGLEVSGPDELRRNWDRIKRDEKKTRPEPSFGGIPPHLPALMRAQKLLDRNQGEDTAVQKMAPVLLKFAQPDREIKLSEDELGQVLFGLAALGNRLGIDCEQALRNCTRSFSKGLENL